MVSRTVFYCCIYKRVQGAQLYLTARLIYANQCEWTENVSNCRWSFARNTDLNDVNCRMPNIFFPNIININQFNFKHLFSKPKDTLHKESNPKKVFLKIVVNVHYLNSWHVAASHHSTAILKETSSVYFRWIPHKTSCCRKNSTENQMCIHPLLKIVPNKLLFTLCLLKTTVPRYFRKVCIYNYIFAPF